MPDVRGPCRALVTAESEIISDHNKPAGSPSTMMALLFVDRSLIGAIPRYSSDRKQHRRASEEGNSMTITLSGFHPPESGVTLPPRTR